jgi:hypothetical protein
MAAVRRHSRDTRELDRDVREDESTIMSTIDDLPPLHEKLYRPDLLILWELLNSYRVQHKLAGNRGAVERIEGVMEDVKEDMEKTAHG